MDGVEDATERIACFAPDADLLFQEDENHVRILQEILLRRLLAAAVLDQTIAYVAEVRLRDLASCVSELVRHIEQFLDERERAPFRRPVVRDALRERQPAVGPEDAERVLRDPC